MATLTAVAVIIVVAAIAMTIAATTTYAQEPTTTRKADFDANDTITVDRQNEAVLTSSEIQSTIVNPLLFGDQEITHYEVYENGSAVATITGGNFSGAKYYYNHSMTPEFGFTYADNGTVFTPSGEELKIVFGE